MGFDVGSVGTMLPNVWASVIVPDELGIRVEFWCTSEAGVDEILSIVAKVWLPAVEVISLVEVAVILIWSFAGVEELKAVNEDEGLLSSMEDVLESPLVTSLLGMTVDIV